MNRKEQVRAAFGGAAAGYESAARAQDQSAESLARRIAALPLPADPTVLEFGCGTGLLSRRLRALTGKNLLLTDLSPAMAAAARNAVPDCEARVMDAEHPDLGDRRFDLIASNLAAQWFSDLGAAVRRLTGLLNPGGHLIFTTLGSGTFRQWVQAHENLGLRSGVPAFPNALQLAAMLPATARIASEDIVMRYDDSAAFLRELRSIGAHLPAPGHRPLPPGALRRVMRGLGAPVEMTYDVHTVIVTAE